MRPTQRTRAQESRSAIERIYVAMRHLFIRGGYKPIGVSGASLRSSLITLSPEIYGTMADPEKVELNGLLYVLERLPKGIEECRYIRLISREGLEKADFEVLKPPKRIRNCYRLDQEQMYIEMTRGRSDVYDILTHLTFIYNESEKIRSNGLTLRNKPIRDWERLEELVTSAGKEGKSPDERAYTYLSTLLGRTFDEVKEMGLKFQKVKNINSLFHITYWLGKRSMDEHLKKTDREITFSPTLRNTIGHHTAGEGWARNVKKNLYKRKLLNRPVHLISANPHSVLNSLYAFAALNEKKSVSTLDELALKISLDKSGGLSRKISAYAKKRGMEEIKDTAGTNLTVQVIDTTKLDLKQVPPDVSIDTKHVKKNQPVIIVMDYAFGEQAYETIDELLKPYEMETKDLPVNFKSISIMGKAGTLSGEKGDIMIPTSHVFEGTADNYPIENAFKSSDFETEGLSVFEGSMITVLGTSLQNKDVLSYFHKSSWKAVGLEMEGAHYQKAIQAASRIRGSIGADVTLRYAYYASDNPLKTGSTLASGGLGADGVRPTYLITTRILNQILTP